MVLAVSKKPAKTGKWNLFPNFKENSEINIFETHGQKITNFNEYYQQPKFAKICFCNLSRFRMLNFKIFFCFLQ